MSSLEKMLHVNLASTRTASEVTQPFKPSSAHFAWGQSFKDSHSEKLRTCIPTHQEILRFAVKNPTCLHLESRSTWACIKPTPCVPSSSEANRDGPRSDDVVMWLAVLAAVPMHTSHARWSAAISLVGVPKMGALASTNATLCTHLNK